MIQIEITRLQIRGNSLQIRCLSGGFPHNRRVYSPKISVCFEDTRGYIRRIPMVIREHREEQGQAVLVAEQTFDLEYLFTIGKIPQSIQLWFVMQYGALEQEHIPIVLEEEQGTVNVCVQQTQEDYIVIRCVPDKGQDVADSAKACQGTNMEKTNRKPEPFCSKLNRHLFKAMYRLLSYRGIRDDKVFFLSNRRDDLSGNMAFVFEKLKDEPVHIRVLLKNCDMTQFHPLYFWKAAWHAANARVILLDDSCTFLDYIDLKPETRSIQLWHACGAFKTFGYSRLGKAQGPSQRDRNHRFYTHAITSSAQIAPFYAEAFGIPLSHVEATGVPRTDVFFDPAYKKRMQEELLREHPEFTGKRIILFAPTFRGWDKENAYYPEEQFDAVRFMQNMPEDTVLVVKHHPYIRQRIEIPDAWRERIIDLTDSAEINDLLFITDLLITDYSSVIFEASLLDIPMVFYAFDLDEYIRNRDFYYEFIEFVPGVIVESWNELVDVIHRQKFETEKIAAFKTRFFDHLDGRSSERVAELVMKDVRGEAGDCLGRCLEKETKE